MCTFENLIIKVNLEISQQNSKHNSFISSAKLPFSFSHKNVLSKKKKNKTPKDSWTDKHIKQMNLWMKTKYILRILHLAESVKK